MNRLFRHLALVPLLAAAVGLHAAGTPAKGLAVLSDRAPVLNGGIVGDLQVNEGRAMAFNRGASVEGSLRLPGSPRLRFNGGVEEPAVVEGTGAEEPEGYPVVFNRGASIDRIVTRSDPRELPAVPAPAPPAGYRWAAFFWPGAGAGDFATVRHIAVGGWADPVSVPPGSYATLFAGRGATVILGSPGAGTPEVYEFDRIFLNGARLEIAGPVLLRLHRGLVSSGGRVGEEGESGRLTVEVHRGGLILNRHSSLHGAVAAPSGGVAVNAASEIAGTVRARRIVVNRGGLVRHAPTRLDAGAPPGEARPPEVSFESPPAGYLADREPEVVALVEAGDLPVDPASVSFLLDGTPVPAGSVGPGRYRPLWSAPLADGTYALGFEAADTGGNLAAAEIGLRIDATAPELSVLSPAPLEITEETRPEARFSVVDAASGIDPASLAVRWEHETTATVSGDGAWVEFAVTHFSSYDINVGPSQPAEPPSTGEVQPPEQEPEEEEKDPYVSVSKGTGHYNFALPAHRSLGRSRALAFAYDSGHATATELFSFPTESRLSRNMVRRLRLDFGGRSDEVLTAGEGAAGQATHNALRFTREDLPSGIYPYRAVATNEYFGTYGQTVRFGGRSVAFTDVPTRERISRPAVSEGWLPFRNESDSPFGAGWTLQPLASLAVAPDRSQAAIFEGDGGHTRFGPASDPRSFDPWNRELDGFDDDVTAFIPAADGGWYFASGGSLYRGGPGEAAERLTEPFTFLNDLGYFVQETELAIDAIAEAPTGEVYFSVSPPYEGVEDDSQILHAIYRLGPGDEAPVLLLETASPVTSLAYNPIVGEILYVEDGRLAAVAEAGSPRPGATAPADLRALAFDAGRGRAYAATSGAVLFADSADPAAADYEPFFDAAAEGFELLPGGLAILPDGRVAVLAEHPDAGVNLLLLGRSGQLLLEQPLSGAAWRFDYLAGGPRGDLYLNDPVDDSRLRRVTGTAADAFVSPTAKPQFLAQDGDDWIWSDTHGNRRRFDADGRLLSETDRNGNATAYAYDAEGRLVSLTDPAGLVTELAYEGGRLASVTDPAGRVTAFTHNAAGQLTRVDYPDGSAQTFEYDAANRLLAFTDRAGARTAFEVAPDGAYREIRFPDEGVIRLEAARDRAVGDTPVAPGLPVLDITPGELAPSIPTASPDTIVDQKGADYAYLGDGRGQFLKVLDAEGHETDFRRDAFGRATGITDPVDAVHRLSCYRSN